MRTALPVLHGADDEWYTPTFPRGDLAALFTLAIHGPGGAPRAMTADTKCTTRTNTWMPARLSPGTRDIDWGPLTATYDGEGSGQRARAPGKLLQGQ